MAAERLHLINEGHPVRIQWPNDSDIDRHTVRHATQAQGEEPDGVCR